MSELVVKLHLHKIRYAQIYFTCTNFKISTYTTWYISVDTKFKICICTNFVGYKYLVWGNLN